MNMPYNEDCGFDECWVSDDDFGLSMRIARLAENTQNQQRIAPENIVGEVDKSSIHEAYVIIFNDGQEDEGVYLLQNGDMRSRATYVLAFEHGEDAARFAEQVQVGRPCLCLPSSPRHAHPRSRAGCMLWGERAFNRASARAQATTGFPGRPSVRRWGRTQLHEFAVAGAFELSFVEQVSPQRAKRARPSRVIVRVHRLTCKRSRALATDALTIRFSR